MPTQFNTKDSGRRTESLTAMTTHALQNDRFISARTHRRQPHNPGPDDTAVSVRGVKPADTETDTQTKPLDKHFAFPERLFCPLHEAAAATFVSNRFVRERLSNKMLRTYLLVSGSKSSHVPWLTGLWLWMLLLRWAPLCVCQRHVIITERRTVRSCALHPGCWGERMSAVWGGGEGGERSGYVEHLCSKAQERFSHDRTLKLE